MKHPKVQFTAFCAFFEFLIDETLPKMLLTATKVPNVHFKDPKGPRFFFKGFSFDHKLKQKVALNTETYNHIDSNHSNQSNQQHQPRHVIFLAPPTAGLLEIT